MSIGISIFGRYFAKGTADNWERYWITPRRRLESGDWAGHDVQAQFGMHYLKGNSAPYISVTGEIRDPKRRGRGEPECSGCCHDEIARVFPELRRLIALHLNEVSGKPSHYATNAAYWAEFVMDISRWEFDQYGQFARAGRTARDAFESHVLWGELGVEDAATIAAVFEPIEVETPSGVIFEGFADSPAGRVAARKILAARVCIFCAARFEAIEAHALSTLHHYQLTKVGIPTREEWDDARSYDAFGRAK